MSAQPTPPGSATHPGGAGRPYAAVPAQVDLPGDGARGPRVLGRRRRVPPLPGPARGRARSGRSTRGRPPPTARPGTHHVEARVFKDVFPRYRTMKGYHVPRKAGWDCHGLPVELAVEKELGFTGKRRHRGLRRRGVQREVPRVGAAPRRRVRRDDRAHGLLGRHGPRLLDDGPGLRRERVVVAEADLRQGPARAGPPGRALLPALRHRRCPTTSSPRATRPSSTPRSTCASR